MSASIKTIFIESYSVFQVLLLIPKIRAAESIIFHEKLYPAIQRQFLDGFFKKLSFKLIRYINRSIKFERIPDAWMRQHNWEANQSALNKVVSNDKSIKTSKIVSDVVKLVGDNKIIRFFKSRDVDYYAGRMLFLAFADHLMAGHNSDELVITPCLEACYDDSQKHYYVNTGYIRSFDQLFRAPVAKLLFLMLVTIYPIVFLLRNLYRLKFTKKTDKSEEYLVLMPILYGFTGEGKVKREGVLRTNDDGYLYDENINPGQIIHLFKKWKKSPNEIKQFKTVMDNRGIRYCEDKDLVIDVAYIKELSLYQLKLLFVAVKNLLDFRDSYRVYVNVIFILDALFDKLIEIHNLNYKVEFVRDDYNSKHIISTILNNHYERKTIGIQHHINIDDYPALAFAWFDHYITYGDLTAKSFRQYWNGIKIEDTGRENIDWMVSLMMNQSLLENIKHRINSIYGKRKYILTIVLPSGRELIQKEQWYQMYESLKAFIKTEIDCSIFLRFRDLSNIDNFPHCKRVAELAKEDERIIIDHENFTTHELLVASDLVIVNAVSFSLAEALLTNAKVFSFAFIGVEKYYYPDYGDDLIIYTKDDFMRVVKGLENGFENFQVEWEKLKNDSNYHVDGNNGQRIRNVVYQATK